MTDRLTTNYAKNYCNRTLIVKLIVENVGTCFLGHSVCMSTALQYPIATDSSICNKLKTVEPQNQPIHVLLDESKLHTVVYCNFYF